MYERFTCPLCERWFQARGGAMFAIQVDTNRVTRVCFLCARKLVKLGIIKKDQLPQGDPNIKRIVEI